MNKHFSLREILADAWVLAKKNFWIITGFTAIQFIIILMAVSLTRIFGQKGVVALIQNVLVGLIDAFFTVAIYQVFFKLIDEDGDPEFPDFLPSVVKALNFLVVKLLSGLFVVFIIASVAAVYFFNSPHINTSDLVSWKNTPLLMCILVPVAYVSIRMSFVVCFIVDQDSGVIEAIRQSWVITKGHFWFLLLLFVVVLGINMLGAMAFFVGLLFTVPLSSLIMIIAYRQMVNSYADEEEILLDDLNEN
jgi:membrane-anchored glycerophosphoryl diester phosphodiesterase (GDPDase)